MGRASILWTTLEPGAGSVTLTGSDGRTLTAPANMTGFQPSVTQMPAAFYQYQADILGLRPGTTYSYQVSLDGQNLTSNQFRSAGVAENLFSFLVVGDSGAGSSEEQTLIQRMSSESAALVVHVGDMAYPDGTFSELESYYYGMYAPMMGRIPFFSTPGNHEYLTDSAAPYLAGVAVPDSGVPAADQGRYYSFDWGDVHFVSLDSNLLLTASSSGMLAWLDADLAASGSYWRIVFLHHTPYPTGFHLGDPICAAVQQFVNPIVERHGVQLMLAGHEHGYERTYPLAGGQPVTTGLGTTYIVTGGGGGALESVGTSLQTAFSVEAFNYLRVQVERAKLTLTAIGLDGSEIDQVTLSHSSPMSVHRVTSLGDYAPRIAAGALVRIAGANLSPQHLETSTYPLPNSLAGVEVRVGTQALPLLSVSPGQINAQIPYDAVGLVRLDIATPNGFAWTNVTVLPTAPSLLAVFSDGARFSSRNPARPGAELTVYLTGLGRAEGELETGRATPDAGARVIAPVEVWIGDTYLEPSSAGLAPGVSGIYRVSLMIPHGLADGLYALRVLAAGVSSRPTNLDILSSGDGDRHDRALIKVHKWPARGSAGS